MLPIFYHTSDLFAEKIFSELGKGRRHALALYRQWMTRGSLEKLVVEPQARALLEQIKELTDFSLLDAKIVVSEGETKKFLTQLDGGLEVESVFIPMKTKSTLCISSQVGCQMGCTFCETGRMGLLRSLTRAEIVQQVFLAKHHFGFEVENIVFMGMGEPFDNFEEVKAAIEILLDSRGMGFGPSRITVSTSGVVDKIDRFREEIDPSVHLAVSVNAPNDAIRKKVMPVNRKWDMQALYQAMERVCMEKGREIFVEYVLMEGVNDQIEHADELAEYLRGLKVKVNLIPYNPQSRDRFAPPEQEVIDAFSRRMQERGYLTLVRQKKGQKIMAACGQLGNLQLRKEIVRMSKKRLIEENHG